LNHAISTVGKVVVGVVGERPLARAPAVGARVGLLHSTRMLSFFCKKKNKSAAAYGRGPLGVSLMPSHVHQQLLNAHVRGVTRFSHRGHVQLPIDVHRTKMRTHIWVLA
jgi:hypothetical protein